MCAAAGALVFRALVASDAEDRFHQNHAQLGYALKDQRNPTWAEAEAELTNAIRIRNAQGEEQWWYLYEFNRAVCRISQDQNFPAQKPSAADVRAKIVDDLRAIPSAERVDLFAQYGIGQWVTLNAVTDEELRTRRSRGGSR